jgi:predicted ArsR family transcriptional regulator
MQRLLAQIGRTQRLNAINVLKRSAGLTVRELAGELGMSYMGAKQICLDLEKDGFLQTFRRHHGVGRPEILYSLTEKAQALFPQADNVVVLSLLDQARKLFGAGAPEKLLYLHYQKLTESYLARLGDISDPAERAGKLARIRDQEGYIANLLEDPLRIVERHHPLQGVLDTYPEIVTLEKDMFQKILRLSVTREQTGSGPAMQTVYVLS